MERRLQTICAVERCTPSTTPGEKTSPEVPDTEYLFTPAGLGQSRECAPKYRFVSTEKSAREISHPFQDSFLASPVRGTLHDHYLHCR